MFMTNVQLVSKATQFVTTFVAPWLQVFIIAYMTKFLSYLQLQCVTTIILDENIDEI
jgi:hypothetical protein